MDFVSKWIYNWYIVPTFLHWENKPQISIMQRVAVLINANLTLTLFTIHTVDFLLSGSPWPSGFDSRLPFKVSWFMFLTLLCVAGTQNCMEFHCSSSTPKHWTVPSTLISHCSDYISAMLNPFFNLVCSGICSRQAVIIHSLFSDLWFLTRQNWYIMPRRWSLRIWILYKDEVSISHEFVNQEINLPPSKCFPQCKTLNKFSQIIDG